MWTKFHLTLSALTWTKSCVTFLFNSLWFRHKHNETWTRQRVFLLLYLNMQDDNDMFRNSLNCIFASLTETTLLLLLLHKYKDTYYVHCCLLQFTEINILWIMLKKRPSKEVKFPITDVLSYSSWAQAMHQSVRTQTTSLPPCLARDERSVTFCDPDVILILKNSVQVQPQSKIFFKCEVQVQNIWKMQLFQNKNRLPHLFSINSVQIRSGS